MGINAAADITVAEFQEQGEPAFLRIYAQYHQAVFANIKRLVFRDPEAEDLLQDVFVILWENRQSLQPQQSIPGWLFTTSYYKCLQHIRRSLKQQITELPSLEIADESFGDEMFEERLQIIQQAIELLPVRKRMAFELVRLEGKSFDEAADILQITKESVKDYVKTSSRFIRQYALDKRPDIATLSLLTLSAAWWT
jgi:RNA polymerase sigma-70 factor (ECF subfamily)